MRINGIRWKNEEDSSIPDNIEPPRIINLDIIGQAVNIREYNSSEYQNGDQRMWVPDSRRIEDLIIQVREYAEVFRENYGNNYLDIIDRDLMEQELRDFQGSYSFEGLESLVSSSINSEQEDAWNQISNSTELRSLAYYGHKLYRELFPIDIYADIDLLPIGTQINISWCRYNQSSNKWFPHIPWGLMFQIEPPVNVEIDPMCFLGLRYRIGYVAYADTKRRTKLLGSINSTNRIHCLYWGDRDRLIENEVNWQRNSLKIYPNQIFAPKSGNTQPKEEVVQLFRDPTPKPVNLLYFFCLCSVKKGANNPVLQFGNNQNSITDIITAMEILTEQELLDQPLVFANACSTLGVKDIANELEVNFFERGCRAYIGTETKVPIIFASRFAFIFFYFLYNSPNPISTGEAMTQTKLFLWRRFKNIGGILYSYIGEYELFMNDRI
jgi:hypothetical protein